MAVLDALGQPIATKRGVAALIPRREVKLIPRIPRQARKAPTGIVMPGRILYVKRDPFGDWELPTEIMTPGGIAMVRPDAQHTESLFHGIVIRTGIFTFSSHTRTNDDPKSIELLKKLADCFPLPAGTLVVHTCARPFLEPSDDVYSIVCDHIHSFYLPEEKWPEHLEALREK